MGNFMRETASWDECLSPRILQKYGQHEKETANITRKRVLLVIIIRKNHSRKNSFSTK